MILPYCFVLDFNQSGPPNVVLNFAKFQKLYGHDVSIVSQFKKINYKILIIMMV